MIFCLSFDPIDHYLRLYQFVQNESSAWWILATSCITTLTCYLFVFAEGPNVWLWPLQGDEGQEDGELENRMLHCSSLLELNMVLFYLTMDQVNVAKIWCSTNHISELTLLYLKLQFLKFEGNCHHQKIFALTYVISDIVAHCCIVFWT